MEIVKECSSLLSNYEVLSLLREKQADKKNQKGRKYQQNVATIAFETIRYLENTPCALQNEETVCNFLAAMKSYKLTKAEKLQLLNHRPVSQVELQLMIEENEDRLTDEQIQDIIDRISRTLLTKEEAEDEQCDEDMEADGEN